MHCVTWRCLSALPLRHSFAHFMRVGWLLNSWIGFSLRIPSTLLHLLPTSTQQILSLSSWISPWVHHRHSPLVSNAHLDPLFHSLCLSLTGLSSRDFETMASKSTRTIHLMDLYCLSALWNVRFKGLTDSPTVKHLLRTTAEVDGGMTILVQDVGTSCIFQVHFAASRYAIALLLSEARRCSNSLLQMSDTCLVTLSPSVIVQIFGCLPNTKAPFTSFGRPRAVSRMFPRT